MFKIVRRMKNDHSVIIYSPQDCSKPSLFHLSNTSEDIFIFLIIFVQTLKVHKDIAKLIHIN